MMLKLQKIDLGILRFLVTILSVVNLWGAPKQALQSSKPATQTRISLVDRQKEAGLKILRLRNCNNAPVVDAMPKKRLVAKQNLVLRQEQALQRRKQLENERYKCLAGLKDKKTVVCVSLSYSPIDDSTEEFLRLERLIAQGEEPRDFQATEPFVNRCFDLSDLEDDSLGYGSSNLDESASYLDGAGEQPCPLIEDVLAEGYVKPAQQKKAPLVSTKKFKLTQGLRLLQATEAMRQRRLGLAEKIRAARQQVIASAHRV